MARFKFRTIKGMEEFGAFSGANFTVRFQNGYAVSVADTSIDPSFQRIEVAVLDPDGEFSGEIVGCCPPERMVAIMAEAMTRARDIA